MTGVWSNLTTHAQQATKFLERQRGLGQCFAGLPAEADLSLLQLWCDGGPSHEVKSKSHNVSTAKHKGSMNLVLRHASDCANRRLHESFMGMDRDNTTTSEGAAQLQIRDASFRDVGGIHLCLHVSVCLCMSMYVCMYVCACVCVCVCADA